MKESTLKEIAESNVRMAIDQADEYGGLDGAFRSFHNNVLDTCVEDGYSWEESLDSALQFSQLFKALTGKEY